MWLVLLLDDYRIADITDLENSVMFTSVLREVFVFCL